MHVVLGPGLREDIAVQVFWPARQRPLQVIVDGQERTGQTADGILIERPFKELVARW